MGNFLSVADANKLSTLGFYEDLCYTTMSMRGWRLRMEDAHLTAVGPDVPDFPTEEVRAVFGVFDGHGGPQVSKFVARHFLDIWSETEAFKLGRLEQSLKEAFVAVDRRLLEKSDVDENELLSYSCFSEPGVIPEESRTSREFLPSARPPKCLNCACSQQIKELFTDMSLTTTLNNKTALRKFQSEPTIGESKPSDEMPPKYDSCISSLETLAEGEQSRRKRIASKFRSRKKKIDERGLVKSPTDDGSRLWSSVRHSLNRRKSSASSPRRAGSDGCSSARVAGCTAVVAVLTASRLVVANAGDSRAFLGRSSGVVPLSEDHKPNLPFEKLRIESGGGTVEFGRVNGNLNLSRALGDLHYKQDTSRALEEQIITSLPDVTSVPLSADDEFVFLGCDGLFEFFSNEDIYRFVAHRLVSDAISCRFPGVRSPGQCMIGLNAAVNDIIASMPLTEAHIIPAEIVIPDTGPLPSDATRVSGILERLLNAILSPNPTFVDYGCDNMTAVAIDLRPFRGCPCACHQKALPICVGGSTVV